MLSDPLELKLQVVVSHRVGAGNQIWVFSKATVSHLLYLLYVHVGGGRGNSLELILSYCVGPED